MLIGSICVQPSELSTSFEGYESNYIADQIINECYMAGRGIWGLFSNQGLSGGFNADSAEKFYSFSVNDYPARISSYLDHSTASSV